MNAALLLEYYGRIADAPDAIARLRTLVIALAIRGRITGYMGPWLSTTLGEIGRWGSGGTPSKAHPEFYGGTIPWLVIGDLNDGIVEGSQSTITRGGVENSAAKIVEPNAVLIAMYGSIGKLGINAMPCATNQAIAHCYPFKDCVTRDFLFWLLRSLREDLLGRGQGVAQQNISQKILKAWPVRLPTIAEQHRIVAKVDELMALCDQLEAARVSREAARDAFSLSTLAKLNTPDPETFGQNARFALANLAPLTTRPDQIKQLRQTILNLAVLGKLVEQSPADEIAEVPPLRQFSAASGIDPAVFEKFSKTIALPNGWQIVPLAQLSANIVDCPHTTPKWREEGEICIRTNQLRPGVLDLSAPRYVSPEEYVTRVERLEPLADDILYSREGGILGVACRVPPGVRLCLGQRLMLIRAGAETRPGFLEMVLNSPFITSIAKSCTTGGAAPRVNMSTVRAYPIPLPPLAEQHRIVAKIDELMAICDQLETSITTGEQTRSRLLEAVLHNVLEPA